MKSWKQRVSLLLVVVLAFSLMAGCSSSAPAAPASSAASAAPVSSAAPASSAAPDSSAGQEDPVPNYPGNKTINMICCYGAGGGNDTTARLIAKYFPEYLGNMVVSNVTGSSGRVGSQQVMDSPPDGYTLVFNDANTDMLYAQGLTDYSLEAWGGFYIPAIAESASLQCTEWDTLDEAIAWAKEHPGEFTMGVETGTNTEMAACAFMTEFGIDGKLIDVGSTSNQITALAGGHVKMIQLPVGTTKDYQASGEFKVVAMVLQERHPSYPDVPTLIEKGAADWVYMPRYYYIGFPQGTDQAIMDKFGAALEKICADQRFIDDMKAVELTAKFMGGADAQAYIDQTHPVWLKYAEAVKAFKGE